MRGRLRTTVLVAIAGLTLAVVVAGLLLVSRSSPRAADLPHPAAAQEQSSALHGETTPEVARSAAPAPDVRAVEPAGEAASRESAAEPGPILSARLVDSEGHPITSANEGRLAVDLPLALTAMHYTIDAEGHVHTVSLPLAAPFTPSRVAMSDAEGRVQLELSPDDLASAERGFVTARAVARGYASTDMRLRPPAPGKVRELGDVVLAPGRALGGRVVLPDGVDAARARVLLSRCRRPAREDAIRDQQALYGPMDHDVLDQVGIAADGAFTIEGVSTDACTLWAYASGTSFARVDVEAGVTDRNGLLLVPVDAARAGGCTVEGTVVGPDGAAVPRAWVHVLYADEERAGTSVRTNDEGRFRAVLARPERFTVVALDADFLLGEGRVEAEPCERDVVVQLPERERFRVRVVDGAGRAVGGASIQVKDPSGRDTWFYGSEQLERGVFSVSRPPAPFGLRVTAPGYASALLVLEPAKLGEEDVVCSLELDAAVAGTVVHRGAPVADAIVELLVATPPGSYAATNGASTMDRPFDLVCGSMSGDATRTDDEGRFVLSGSGAGWRVVRAQAEGLGAATSERLELAARGAPVEVVLELPKTGAIAGRVIVRPEVSPSGLLVGACRGDGAVHTAFTDANGEFRIDGLSPGGWQVRRCPPRAEGLDRGGPALRIGFSQSLAVPGAPLWDCEVVESEATRFDLDLRDEGAFVLDGRTSLASGGNVELRRPGVEEGQPLAFAWIEDGGVFRCEMSEGGEYALLVRTSRPGSGTITIADRLTLHRGENAWDYRPALGELVVRMAPGAEEPRHASLVHVLRAARWLEVRTQFSFKGAGSEEGKRVQVPSGPGSVEVTAEGPHPLEPKSVYVPANGEVEVLFEGVDVADGGERGF